jgi:hypothetical protein
MKKRPDTGRSRDAPRALPGKPARTLLRHHFSSLP